MKVCIDDDCYKILRVIKNGVSYEQQFLENVKNNHNADVLINDNGGNILVCKKMFNYEFSEETNTWKHIINSASDTELPQEISENIERPLDANETV